MNTANCILVVDDEPEVRKLLRRTLELAGNSVDEAGNCREALRAVEDKFFDLVILDLSLPGMDGFAVLQAIRRELSHTKIMVISGFLPTTILRAASYEGADGALGKPLLRDQLVRAVDTLLAHCGARQPEASNAKCFCCAA